MMLRLYFVLFLLSCVQLAMGQQEEITSVRRVPALGISVPEADLQVLKSGLNELQRSIEQIVAQQDQKQLALLPDVQIYAKAVDYAIRYHEFFSLKDVESGKKLLREGQVRADALLKGLAPWTTQKGEVVRGYISEIDGSVQPYGLSIPEEYNREGKAFNLSLWFHGRGENLSELNFMANGKGFFPLMPAMKSTIMLYPYGRYCNGFKFAGETDVWEALSAAKRQYKINEQGILNRGFSMGGAAVWQFAVHFPDQWLAANPGAGFAETTDFLKLDKEIFQPNAYEQKLLHLYDCTDYAANLYRLPVIAYNGDKDLQKQAADVMEAAMNQEGLTLKRVTGTNIGHAYTKVAAHTVDSLLELEITSGKKPIPSVVHFTTYTLKYNRMYWVQINALQNHWTKAKIDAQIEKQHIKITTQNISAFSINRDTLSALLDLARPLTVELNGKKIVCSAGKAVLNFYQNGQQWQLGKPQPGLLKKHNLQGPIDDAFMSAFIVVQPSGKSKNKRFNQWSKSEMERFLLQWRRQFRGDAQVKRDVDLTPADLSKNLIAFGDAESNSLIARVIKKLPVKWDATQLTALGKTYPSKDHALVMVYPNPLHPDKYLVLNSGFTFREASFLNNAKQIAVLPDWAVIDLNTPPGPVHPGKIEAAGFFGEHWEWKP